METTKELMSHAQHLELVLASVSRGEFRHLLEEQVAQTQEQIVKLSSQNKLDDASDSAVQNTISSRTDVSPPTKLPSVVSSYVFSQSAVFAKLYLATPGLTAQDQDKVNYQFGELSVRVSVRGAAAGANYHFALYCLAAPIVPQGCRVKVATGKLVLFLTKKTEGHTWPAATALVAQQRKDEAQRIMDEFRIYRKEFETIVKANIPSQILNGVMATKGYYLISDAESARDAPAQFYAHPPSLVHVQFNEQRELAAAREPFRELLAILTDMRCCLRYSNMVSFFDPSDHTVDSELLDDLLDKRIFLRSFHGYLSPHDITRLPLAMFELGLAVANKEVAAAVTGITLPCGLHRLDLSICRSVEPEDLRTLPVPRHTSVKLHLWFCDTGDDDYEWLTKCVRKLLDGRMCWLMLFRCCFSFATTLALSNLLLDTPLLGVAMQPLQLEPHLIPKIKHQFRSMTCQFRVIDKDVGFDRRFNGVAEL